MDGIQLDRCGRIEAWRTLGIRMNSGRGVESNSIPEIKVSNSSNDKGRGTFDSSI